MKTILLITAFIFLIAVCPQSWAETSIKTQKSVYSDLGQTAGFLAGQKAALEKIKIEFPDLAVVAKISEAEFHSSFSHAEKSISSELQSLLKDKFSEYEKNLKNQIHDEQQKQTWSHETAVKFINEVSARANGEIPSPILETLLIHQYEQNPSEEFSRKFLRSFSSKNHVKAKGTNLTISYPASWKAEEGNRPNIVQKFISRNGHGPEMFMLMVRNMPLPDNYIMTDQEKDEFFTEKQLKEMLPENSSFISAKPVILDNFKSGVILFNQTAQRLDLTIKFRSQMYITIVKDKMIFLQFMVTDKQDGTIQERFDKFEPLFKMVANSFIVQDQYD